MTPVIAIVGRPNVGKSTLFNQLTRSRDALVADMPGVTRDRLYGEGKIADQSFIVIDTGGLYDEKTGITSLMAEQSWLAIEESDLVFFVVDAKEGVTPYDRDLANALRKTDKKIYLVVNKTDGLDERVVLADFFELGLKQSPIPIAASHNRGVRELIETALADLPRTIQGTTPGTVQGTIQETIPGTIQEEDFAHENASQEEDSEQNLANIKISIVGRPNVGKSTLVNRILGESRVLVFDEPGTTRDSIYIPLMRFNQPYTLIDTAGVRRRARVHETIEKFSVVKTLQAIKDSDVSILVVDARDGLTDQDLGLLGFVLETGRALVIAFNKWDGLSIDQKNSIKRALQYRLNFVNFARVHFISALHGTGVGNLFDSIEEAFIAATKKLSTAQLTRILTKAVMLHAPPMVQGRRIKLRYAHSGGHSPPLIIIHGNQTEHVPETYRRYLINMFRKELKLMGTPIRIEFKTEENPYAGRHNKLTPRQEYKRKRMRDFVKKKKK